jgi:peptidoglycan hydrolase-like protein with peptidoglycan-binding domain
MGTNLRDRMGTPSAKSRTMHPAAARQRRESMRFAVAVGSVVVAAGLVFATQVAAQQPAPSPLPQSEPGSGPAGSTAAQRSGTASQAGVELPQATIRMLQHSLMQGGYPVSAADGVWGPETAAAVREFQRVKGLQPTGRPDSQTLTALGVATHGITQPAAQRPVTAQPQPDIRKRTPADLDSATIRAIQQALDRQGLQVGPVDGIWGERTASAIGNLQRTLGLPASGEPDAHTLAQLGLLPGTAARPDPSRVGRQPGAGELDPAAIRLIQQALSQRGLDLGQVDGVWGDRTMDALREFQRSHGIEPLGEPDVHTLAALGILPGSDTRPAGGSGPLR